MSDLPSNQSSNFIAGTNVTITFTETEGDYWDITFDATGGSGGVDSIAKSGSTGLTGDVTLSEGSNVTLTQVGQDIEIASTASGSGGHTITEDDTPLTARTNLNFSTGLDVADDAINDASDVTVDLSEVSAFTDHSARHENAGADEISIDGLDGTPVELTNHAAAVDPHAGYRLESADHTHQSTGAQAGQLDHGLALTGLTDDDHTQYRLESADHTHQSTGLQGGTLDHGLALTGLTDDDHTQYRLESVDHTHQSTGAEAGQLDHGLALTGLTDDDHTQYRLESADHTHQSTGLQGGTLDHGLALTGLTDDDHTQYLKETDVDAVTFTIGAFFDGNGSTLSTGIRPIWRAPFACTVTQVRGYVDTGTTTVINAGTTAGGTENFCSSDITIDPADAWEAGTVDQNQSVTSGETVSVEIVTAGTATQLTIQVELTRDLSP